MSVELTRMVTPGRPLSNQPSSSSTFVPIFDSPSPVKPEPWAKNARPTPYHVLAPALPCVQRLSFWSNLERCSASLSTEGEPTLSVSTMPVGVVSPACRQFFSRNSCGAMPSAPAQRSICDSMPHVACGAPKPRNAPDGKVWVRPVSPLMWTFAQR